MVVNRGEGKGLGGGGGIIGVGKVWRVLIRVSGVLVVLSRARGDLSGDEGGRVMVLVGGRGTGDTWLEGYWVKDIELEVSSSDVPMPLVWSVITDEWKLKLTLFFFLQGSPGGVVGLSASLLEVSRDDVA